MAYKPKHITDGKLLIKLSLDLFVYSVINSKPSAAFEIVDLVCDIVYSEKYVPKYGGDSFLNLWIRR